MARQLEQNSLAGRIISTLPATLASICQALPEHASWRVVQRLNYLIASGHVMQQAGMYYKVDAKQAAQRYKVTMVEEELDAVSNADVSQTVHVAFGPADDQVQNVSCPAFKTVRISKCIDNYVDANAGLTPAAAECIKCAIGKARRESYAGMVVRDEEDE